MSLEIAQFLIELLTYEAIQGKEHILDLLAHLAQGDGYNHQHLHVENEYPGTLWRAYRVALQSLLHADATQAILLLGGDFIHFAQQREVSC